MQTAGRGPAGAWCLYDWANSAFTTTIMAGFFPIFFKQFWSTGVDTTVSTARLGMANSLAGIVVAMLAPVLGAIADQGTARKRFLIFFAYMGVVSTLGLYLVEQGNWIFAMVLYVFGAIGFSGGNVFYDALLTLVASRQRMDFVSALGYSMGYLGGGLLFAINVWMTLKPGTFGFADSSSAVRFSFLTVGIWWGLFTIPIILWVKEPKRNDGMQGSRMLRGGLGQLVGTLREIRRLRSISLFLIAYWLYIDGVDTVVRMAVDYGMSIGFEANDLIVALLITQFVGFPSALAFGFLGRRIGARRCILFAISVYLGVSIWGAFMRSQQEFYILAVIIGLVQGGIQALSRSYFGKMIPAERAAEYFGFYNMVGKFAAVIGPVLMGGIGLIAREMGFDANEASRIGISSLSLLFLAGGGLFLRVDDTRAREEILDVEGL